MNPQMYKVKEEYRSNECNCDLCMKGHLGLTTDEFNENHYKAPPRILRGTEK